MSVTAPAPTLTKARRSRLIDRATPYTMVAPTLVLLVLLFAVPAVYNVWLSMHKVTPYDAVGEGDYVGLANFRAVLSSSSTWFNARNTLVWLTLATVVIRLVLALGLAVLLQAPVLRRLHLLGIARTSVLLPWMIPPTVAVAAWKWLLDGRTGLVNKLLIHAGVIDQGIPFFGETATVWPAVVTVMVWRELPFVVIAFMAGLQSVSTDQYEAAAIDGASGWRSFWYITLPNLRPVIVIIALLITIQSFNNFLYVWLTTGGGPGTYTQVLATQLFTTAFVDNQLGRGAAVGLLMSGFMLLFAVAYLFVTLRSNNE